MAEGAQHPLDYLVVFKRRKMWFWVPLAVCVLGGLALALLLPATYRSSARVAVAAPAVAPDLVPVRGGLDRDERVRALGQQLRSPAVLERVAREEGLIADRPLQDVAQDLIERISVELPTPIARAEPELNAFDIVYKDRTAERARRITNRLAQVFVDEYSRSREIQAEGTAEFVGTQLRASQDRIANLEMRLRAAKENHMGKLPEQTLANLQTLSGTRQQLETTSNNLRSEQDRVTMIDRQLQMMQEGNYAAPAGTAGVQTSPQQRVTAIERQLADARAKYNDNHPEVRISAGRAQDRSGRSRGHLRAAGVRAPAAARRRPDLPAARRRSQPRAAPHPFASAHRSAAPAGHRSVPAARRSDADGRTGAGVDAARVRLREGELQAAVREACSRAGTGADRARARRRTFQRAECGVLARVPGESQPAAARSLIAVALGIGLGGGLAFGREYLDRSVRDASAFQAEFDVPVLAEIPRIRDAA